MSIYTDASLIVTPNSYKVGTLYSLKGTDLGVVRATTATYVGSDGLIKTALANEVRFDYSNGSCPSILVEPQRTNLLLRSEEFDNAYWSSSMIRNANETISPSGTMTADLVQVSGGSGVISRAITITNSAHSFSVYAKKGNWDIFRIVNGSSASNVAWFDLTNGTTSNVIGGTSQIINVGNGWYRCIYNTTTPNTTAGVSFVLSSAMGSAPPPSNGSNIYLWGAQLEAGSNATSYIPTVASTVTRNADVISKTGISDLINSSELTLFIDFDTNITNASSPIDMIILDDGTTSNYVSISIVSNYVYTRTFSGGVFRQILGGQTSPQRFKIAVKIKQNSFKFFRNGIKINEITDNNMPTGLNRIKLGEKADAFINTSLIFQNLLTDQECIDITTL